MNKKHYLGMAVITALLLATASMYAINNNKDTLASLSNSTISDAATSSHVSNQPSPEPVAPTSGKPITVTGTIDCIPPAADASGRQTQSCAMGIKDDFGNSYGLYSEDAAKMVGLATGQRAQISGTLAQSNAQQTNIEGVIHITSVQKL